MRTNQYGPFNSWTNACRAFHAVVRNAQGPQPLVRLAADLMGNITLGIDLVSQFKARQVIYPAGGSMADPLYAYSGIPFGHPAIDT